MEKQYINGVFFKEKVFENGGSQIKTSIKVDEFIKQLQEIKNEKGYANININKRREPSEKGITHYAEVDTWKPEKQKDNSAENPEVLPF
jgi:hypothetical protein